MSTQLLKRKRIDVVATDGSLDARLMAVAQVADDSQIRLVTDRNSGK